MRPERKVSARWPISQRFESGVTGVEPATLCLARSQDPGRTPVASAGLGLEGEKTLRLAMNGRDSADTLQTHGSGP